ncbi:putative toxin-antitoxin system toxin component, PIN family [Ottowia sp.]|uniref:putative toxin-antitoxin system toxin component, PIN family n=1 Tax=Ottowia sp. TaxID=1898956 RepID=UPI0025D54D12|nr:putative toxin-antitoxin system toxin component, PIN family [Ottowia sp.]MBK6746184.1 putative toxin-antitoxin system toxin component, PIN family [Ottowia sp.]
MSARCDIVDTNVVVAALLTQAHQSPVARVLDGMLLARFPFALSEPLLAEYRAVLLRPRISARHRLAEADIDLILTDLAQHAIVVEAAPGARQAPDPKDQMLWDLLAACPGSTLVTGDALLLAANDAPGPIRTPAQWVAECKA